MIERGRARYAEAGVAAERPFQWLPTSGGSAGVEHLGGPSLICLGLNLLRKYASCCFASYSLQNREVIKKMQAMTDKIRLLSDLAPLLKALRESAGLSKSELAQRAGKVREVIYRLESGEDVTVSSLLAVLGAMGLALQIVKAGLPTMQEVADRFAEDEE